MEIEVEFEPGDAAEYGIIVRRSPDGAEQTPIIYNAATGTLRIDLSRSTLDKTVVYQRFCAPPDRINEVVDSQDAPLELAPGEPLRLRIFLDRSIIEVYANSRQCLTQRVYPSRPDSTGVALLARGGSASVSQLTAWDMAPTNGW